MPSSGLCAHLGLCVLMVNCKSWMRHLLSLYAAINLQPLPLENPFSARSKHLSLQERDLEALVKRFKTDLHNCVAYIQEPRQLKEKVRGLFEKYVQRADMVSSASLSCFPLLSSSPLAHCEPPLAHQVEIAEMNTDLQQEYARQREHLERNLATLKKKVVKDSELHRTDYVRIMQVSARSP